MARIPTRSPTGAAPGVPSLRIPAATGIGEGLAALGAAVTDEGLAAIERAATLSAQRALAESRESTGARLIEQKQGAEVGAPGFTDQALADFDAEAGPRINGVPEIARSWLEGQLAFDRERLSGDAAAFEALSRLEKNKQDTLDVVTSAANAVRTDATRYEDSLFLARDAISSSGLSATSRAIATEESDERVTVAYVQGLNETDPALAARILKDGTIDDLISPASKNVLVNDNLVERRRRQAARNAQLASARSEIRDVIGLLEQGFDPGTEKLVRLSPLAATDKALAKDLGDALEVYEFQRTARGMPPADLQNWISGERARLAGKTGVTTAEAARIKAAESLLTKMSEGVGRDPLSWAARAGVHAPSPLILAGDDAAASIAQRRQDAEAVGSYYGIRPRYLTDEEADQLTAQIDGLDADGQLGLAAAVAGFGDAAPDVFGEFAGKGAILFAHAGGILKSGGGNAARDILVGAKAMATGARAPAPLSRASADVLGPAAFAMSPSTGVAHGRATEAIYVARAARQGLGGDAADFDADLWERAAQEAAGALYAADGRQFGGMTNDWNGFPVVVPPEIPIDDFADTVSRINDGDLAAAGAVFGNGEPFTAVDLRESWLVSAGHGQYRISLSDPAEGDPVWLGDAGGTRPYVLDLLVLLPGLKGRTLPANLGIPALVPEDE